MCMYRISLFLLQISAVMVKKGVVTTAILLLLQLSILCCDGQNLHSQCENQTCHVYPGNFGDLQKIISSNKLIVLNGVEFNVNGSNGFIVIENVSNLTISGGERGSLIQCSPDSTFGLYLKNTINITLTGITMRGCASYIPNYKMRYNLVSNETTILIENSRTINLFKVLIDYSLGIPLTVFDSVFGEPVIANVNSSLNLTFCTFSHSRGGPVSILGAISLVIENTLIVNCTRGFESQQANIIIKHFNISNSFISFVRGGHVLIAGTLIITNSSLVIDECNILITGDKFVPALTVTDSRIHVRTNSVLQFRRLNASFLGLVQSMLILDTNSTMVFTQNSADSRVVAIYLFQSGMVVVNGSSLTITNNTLTEVSKMLMLKSSTLIVRDGIVRFEDNKCQHSAILLVINTELTWENVSLVITRNAIHHHSSFFYFWGGTMDFKESFLAITNNSVTVSSIVFHNEISILTLNSAKLLLEKNKCMHQSSLVETESTTAKFEMGTLINSTCNEVYQTSSIIYFTGTSWASSVHVNESILMMTDNFMTDSSTSFVCEMSTCVFSGVKFIFKGNECGQNHSALVESSSAKIKFQKGSLVDFTHNKMHNSSYIFIIQKSSLYVNESSLSIANNLLKKFSLGFWCVRSFSIVLDAAVLVFKDNECENCYFLMYIYNSTIRLEKQSLVILTHNKIYESVTISFNMGALVINESSIAISDNNVTYTHFLSFHDSALTLSSGKLLLERIRSWNGSVLMRTIDTSVKIGNTSFVSFVNHSMENKSLLFHCNQTSWNMSSDSELWALNINSAGVFISTNASFGGTVRIAHCRGVDIVSSVVRFAGSLEVMHISTGGLWVINSDVYLTNRALFSNNKEPNGGAMSLISSVLHISPNASVNFTNNTAGLLGGAIYISEPRTTFSKLIGREFGDIVTVVCSIQVIPDNSTNSCKFFNINFHQNKAGKAGNAIYGDYTSACLPCGKDSCSTCPIPDGSEIFHYIGVNDSSDLSNFTSDPTRVCFCENNIPNCHKIINKITVHPGETFNLSLVIVGYGWGTVPGSVIARDRDDRDNSGKADISKIGLLGSASQVSQQIEVAQCQDLSYSIVSERDKEEMSLAVNLQSFVFHLKDTQSFLDYMLTGRTDYSYRYSVGRSSIHEDFFYIPVFVEVDLLACPVGFQLVRGRCVCHQILLNNNIDTCFFSNGTGFILRPAPYWIGLPNDTNSSILIHPHCPFDYCQLQDISITAESVNTQCQYQRSGVLCGSCREGLSMILGSSECKTCSNVYLVSFAIFILMGVALVTILTLLNMTVSVGTLNGLILFANILQANRTTFLPPNTSHASSLIAFLSAFIAWLNLDVGIPMCFFDGLTTYVKTWLQFVFPLYILALVGVMIIASNYSTRMTRLLGTNAVSVLATLVLLSYTKILRILITAFSFTTLTGSQDYHSVVWLADGNIKYFQPKHTILFLVALLVLLLLGVPYTITLTAAPWIQRSRFKWVSSLYNRFKPLFDAYMGPYKDRHRYWTGMLLLARVVLIVLFSSIANTNTVAGPQLNLLLLSLSSFALFGLTTTLKPYKKKLLNGLEIFHLMILFIFSSSNLYVSNIGTGTGPRVCIYIVLVGICFLVFLGICVGHVWYRVRKTGTGRRPEPPEREEDEWQPLWHRARVRAEDEDEEREEATISTAGANSTISYRGRRSSLLELIADNVQM